MRHRIYGNHGDDSDDQYYNHKLFDMIQEITSNMSSNTHQCTLHECIEKLGRALREDFDEEDSDSASGHDATNPTSNQNL